MKILQVANQLSVGGTEKTVIKFSQFLNECGEECSIFSFKGGRFTEKAKKASQRLVIGDMQDYLNLLIDLCPDIVHIHRGGWQDDHFILPYLEYKKRNFGKSCLFETNIFGDIDRGGLGGNIDYHLFVSEYIKSVYENSCEKQFLKDRSRYLRLYNPISHMNDYTSQEKSVYKNELRRIYQIPDSQILALRMGRAANFFGISVQATKYLIENNYDIRILSFGTPKEMKETMSGIDRFVFSDDYVYDEERLNLVYAGCDVLIHDRIDGETFGMVIAESMMNKTPVVTHVSTKYQGQIETMSGDWQTPVTMRETPSNLIKIRNDFKEMDGGYIVGMSDYESYAKCILKSLTHDRERCHKRALNYETFTIGCELISHYERAFS